MSGKVIKMPELLHDASDKLAQKDYMICDFFECGVMACRNCAVSTKENFRKWQSQEKGD